MPHESSTILTSAITEHGAAGTVVMAPSRRRTSRINVSLPARFRWCRQNLCRLLLIKVWFQMALVLAALGWRVQRNDSPSTVAAVSVTLVLSSWMMSRERIRHSFAGDKFLWGFGGRVDDDWATFGRPLLCLDEINRKRKLQEHKDQVAFRVGLACTMLAGVVAYIGVER